jgi:hypothetical protein
MDSAPMRRTVCPPCPSAPVSTYWSTTPGAKNTTPFPNENNRDITPRIHG